MRNHATGVGVGQAPGVGCGFASFIKLIKKASGMAMQRVYQTRISPQT
jgi:hypothetical protein